MTIFDEDDCFPNGFAGRRIQQAVGVESPDHGVDSGGSTNHLLVKSPYTGPLLVDIDTGATQPVNTLADWTVGTIPGGL
jgi:hypothetical protein